MNQDQTIFVDRCIKSSKSKHMINYSKDLYMRTTTVNQLTIEELGSFSKGVLRDLLFWIYFNLMKNHNKEDAQWILMAISYIDGYNVNDYIPVGGTFVNN
jgi:hypothetical protein